MSPHILFGGAMVALFAASIFLAYLAPWPDGQAGAYVGMAFTAISNIIAVIAGLLFGERREKPAPEPTDPQAGTHLRGEAP